MDRYSSVTALLLWIAIAGIVLCLLPATSLSAQAQVLDRHDVMSAGSMATSPASASAATTIAPMVIAPNPRVSDPRVSPNTRVNDPQQPFPNGLLGRSETTVAGTDDGQFLVVGFNDAQGFCDPLFGGGCTNENPPGLSGFGFSSDRGFTWTDGGAPPALGSTVFTRGDPWLDRGGFDQATFYYANLAIDAISGASLGVSVHRGHFSNGVFSFEDVRSFNAPNPNDSYDKEAIAASKDGNGDVYVTVTNFKEVCGVAASGFGEITVWRSHDGGITWQGPTVAGPDLSDLATCDPVNGPAAGILQQSSVPAIGPNGELYVVWSQGPTFSSGVFSTDAKIVVATSADGGVTFSAPVTVASINSMRRDTPVGYNRNRINDHPRIAVALNDRNEGRVHVVFYSAAAPVGPEPFPVTCPPVLPNTAKCEGQNLVSSQVFISHSDDGGATWSAPMPLAPAEPATGVKRFWPVVDVQSHGRVDVVYLESQETTTASNPECIVNVGTPLRRVGTANSLVNTFWVQSQDGGDSFNSPIQMSDTTSNWCTVRSNIRPNFGDYIGAASGRNLVMATWGDGRNAVPDTFYASGLSARKSH
jgi:hypothetical protein